MVLTAVVELSMENPNASVFQTTKEIHHENHVHRQLTLVTPHHAVPTHNVRLSTEFQNVLVLVVSLKVQTQSEDVLSHLIHATHRHVDWVQVVMPIEIQFVIVLETAEEIHSNSVLKLQSFKICVNLVHVVGIRNAMLLKIVSNVIVNMVSLEILIEDVKNLEDQFAIQILVGQTHNA